MLVRHGLVLDLEAKAGHTALVLLNCGLALLRGIIGLGEKHAVIAGGLLGLANAAGLYRSRRMSVNLLYSPGMFSAGRCGRTLGFSDWAGC